MHNNFLKFLFLILLLVLKSSGFIIAQTDKKDDLFLQINKFKQEKENFEKDTTYIKLLNRLSYELKYSNKDSSKLLCQKTLELSEIINFKKGAASAYLIQEINEILEGNYNLKSKNLDSVRAICKQIKFDSLLAISYNTEAIINLHKNKYDETFKLYLKALMISRKDENKFVESIIIRNIASLFTILGNKNEAINYYQQSLILSNELKDTFGLAKGKCNLGFLFFKKNQNEKALKLLNQSIELFLKYDKKLWLSFAHCTKGDIFLKEKQLDSALYYYNLSNKTLEPLQDNIRKSDLLLSYSKFYFEKRKYQKSLTYAQKGLKLSKNNKYQIGISNFHEMLYKIYRVKGNNRLALDNFEKHKILSDSISLKDKENELLLLNAKEEFHKEKQEINITTNKVIKKQRSYISYILIALFISITFAYYVFTSKNTIKKLNQQLKKKTEILEENELRLQSINENQEKLFSIIGHDLKAPIIALKNILKLIKDGSIKPEEFTPFVPKLYNDVDAMSFTLNNLIYWGKTQMKGFKIFPKKMDLKTSIDESIKLLSEIANQKNIDIINESTQNSFILADKNHISLIIRNLISNAIKYSKKDDEIILKTNELPNHYELIIRDNGVGIPKETLAKINTIESLIESTYGTNNEKGTGIGLKLCYEMIALNGGTIRVNSKIDIGTTFYITFPKASS
jgi:signal transduction histidine kinase